MAAIEAMTCLIDNVAELTDVRDRDELEDTLASAMFELTGAASLSMWRVAPKSRRVELRRCVWLEAERSAGARKNAGSGREEHAAGASKPALLACYDSKTHQTLGPDRCGLYREVFPVANSRDVIRLLEIQRVSPLHEEEARLILGLLRIYRNHLRMLEHSDCDALTGLLNRRTFEETFQNLVSSSAGVKEKAAGKRARTSVGERKVHLAMLDIDYFKRINDRFGHPYGDEVLVLLSRLLSENFRGSEKLFRFGGEEFLIMLPSTTAKGARTALQRFRATVEKFEFPQVGRVTVSIGCTTVNAEDSAAVAFGRADQALYVAKQQGRNQVRYFEDLVASGALQHKTQAAQEVELF